MAWHVRTEKVHVNHGFLITNFAEMNFFPNWNSFETGKAHTKKINRSNLLYVNCIHFYIEHGTMEIWWASTTTQSYEQQQKKWTFDELLVYHQSTVEKKTRGLSFNFIYLSVFAAYVEKMVFVVIYLECHTKKQNDWSEAEVFCL